MYDAIRKARELRWEPTSPNDWKRYLQALDYESPDDEVFLADLEYEAQVWLDDNFPSEVVPE